MKKTFTLITGSLLLGLSAQAQQLPNNDFESQTPWSSDENYTTVDDWSAFNNSSHTTQGLASKDVDYTGDESKKSVKLTNKYIGVKILWTSIGSNSPGYLTTGQDWTYITTKVASCDGGTHGGIAFTARPDSISAYIKRTHGTEKPEEEARLVAYSWRGTTTSASIGGTDYTNLDRNIIGRVAPASTSEDFSLVAATDYAITGDYEDWTRLAVALDYKTDETPEMFNVIFSSSNYWTRGDIGAENTLSVDAVRLIYNTKLKSLSIGGEAVADFDQDTYSYTVSGKSLDAAIDAAAFGKDATISVTTEGNVKTITVTDENAAEKVHTYTITYTDIPVSYTLPTTAPTATYGDATVSLGVTSTSPADFSYDFSNTGVVELRDGQLAVVGAGTVDITVSQAASAPYAAGSAAAVTVTVAKADLTVTANSYTIHADDELPAFEVSYDGFVNDEEADAVFGETLPTAGIGATDALTVGEYPITVTLPATAPANYNVTAVDGVLTVTVATGIGLLTQGTVAISYSNGSIHLPAAGAYTVYTAAGQRIAAGEGSTIALPVGKDNVYIVKTAQGTFRIVAQ